MRGLPRPHLYDMVNAGDYQSDFPNNVDNLFKLFHFVPPFFWI
ncbi:hypothetical protein [Helicobacter sp. 13S00477-4]|nr:hypothetical protein [Helicobacter sp. 13S00477-4]